MLTIFQKDPSAYYNGEFIKVSNLQELKDLEVLVRLFEMRHKHLLMKLIEKMMNLKQKGLSNYDILMFNVSDEIQAVAQAYGENIAMKACFSAFAKLK